MCETYYPSDDPKRATWNKLRLQELTTPFQVSSIADTQTGSGKKLLQKFTTWSTAYNLLVQTLAAIFFSQMFLTFILNTYQNLPQTVYLSVEPMTVRCCFSIPPKT